MATTPQDTTQNPLSSDYQPLDVSAFGPTMGGQQSAFPDPTFGSAPAQPPAYTPAEDQQVQQSDEAAAAAADKRLAVIQQHLEAKLAGRDAAVQKQFEDYKAKQTAGVKSEEDLMNDFIAQQSVRDQEAADAQAKVTGLQEERAGQALSDEQRLEQFAQNTPTQQAAFASVMHMTPVLALLATVGGALTKTSGLGMLGAMNGIIQGVNQGAENKFTDAMNQWHAQYDAYKQHMEAMQRVYDMLEKAYQGRADAKEKASQVARTMLKDQLAVQDMKMGSSKELLDFQIRIGQTLGTLDTSLARIEEANAIRKAKQQGESGRQAIYTNRMVGAANQITAAVRNLVMMPIGAGTSMFGQGRYDSILHAPVSALATKISPNEWQIMDRIQTGLARQLGQLETYGLAVTNSVTSQLSNTIIHQGDSYESKLSALAEIRQIVERGMAPLLVDPNTAAQKKVLMNQILAQIRQEIPFTQEDVINATFPKTKSSKSIMDYARERLKLPAGASQFQIGEAGAESAGFPAVASGYTRPPPGQAQGPAPSRQSTAGLPPLPGTDAEAVKNKVYDGGQYGPVQYLGNGQYAPVRH